MGHNDANEYLRYRRLWQGITLAFYSGHLFMHQPTQLRAIMVNKLTHLACDAIDCTVDWSDWCNPLVWQALAMAAIANSLQPQGWIE